MSLRPLSIGIITPAPQGSLSGNAITADRWATLLRELDHRVTVQTSYADESYDLLISIHAIKSAAAIDAFRARFPERPQILALSGTDLYGDLENNPVAMRAMAQADRYVVLQPCGLKRLPVELRSRAVAIHQSLPRIERSGSRDDDAFTVCVLSHLRDVKDPLRVAAAARLMPDQSQLRVIHAGRILEHQLGLEAKEEMAANTRYRWVGELEREAALELLARSDALVLPSRMEGGANVVSEAIAAGVPVLSSRIDGSVGILGDDYPGYFPVGDEQALAHLLQRAEQDDGFLADLRSRIERLAGLIDPARERDAWRRLLESLR